MFVKVIFLNSSLTTWGRRSFLSLVKLRCLTAFTGRTVGVGGQLFLKGSLFLMGSAVFFPAFSEFDPFLIIGLELVFSFLPKISFFSGSSASTLCCGAVWNLPDWGWSFGLIINLELVFIFLPRVSFFSDSSASTLCCGAIWSLPDWGCSFGLDWHCGCLDGAVFVFICSS